MLLFYILTEVLLHSVFIHKNSLDCVIEMCMSCCVSISLTYLIKLVTIILVLLISIPVIFLETKIDHRGKQTH